MLALAYYHANVVGVALKRGRDLQKLDGELLGKWHRMKLQSPSLKTFDSQYSKVPSKLPACCSTNKKTKQELAALSAPNSAEIGDPVSSKLPIQPSEAKKAVGPVSLHKSSHASALSDVASEI